MKKQEYNNFVIMSAKDMEQWLRESFVSDDCQHLETFKLKKIETDWSKRRTCSRGGWYHGVNGPGINIAMNRVCKSTYGQSTRWYEYASFDRNKDIGGFYYYDPEDSLIATVAHEVAHAAQYHRYYSNPSVESRDKPHGRLFKYYYKALRRKFVNPYLPDQAVLEIEYKKEIKKIRFDEFKFAAKPA